MFLVPPTDGGKRDVTLCQYSLQCRRLITERELLLWDCDRSPSCRVWFRVGGDGVGREKRIFLSPLPPPVPPAYRVPPWKELSPSNLPLLQIFKMATEHFAKKYWAKIRLHCTLLPIERLSSVMVSGCASQLSWTLEHPWASLCSLLQPLTGSSRGQRMVSCMNRLYERCSLSLRLTGLNS